MKNSEKLPKSVDQDRKIIRDLILLESYHCADTKAKKTFSLDVSSLIVTTSEFVRKERSKMRRLKKS